MPFDGTNYDTPVTNPVTELLERAWRLIDKPQKWTRGNALSADGRRYCSVGALHAALSPEARCLIYDNTTDNPASGALACLHQAMKCRIPAFNDNHSHAEVATAWQRAIKLSRNLP